MEHETLDQMLKPTVLNSLSDVQDLSSLDTPINDQVLIKQAHDTHWRNVNLATCINKALHVESTVDDIVNQIEFDYDSSTDTLLLKNRKGDVISSFDATAFVKDGMLQSVTLVGNELVFVWNTDSNSTEIRIDLKTLIPELTNYKSGDGISIVNDVISLEKLNSTGTHTKVIVDEYGRVIGSAEFTSEDLPVISVEDINGLPQELEAVKDKNYIHVQDVASTNWNIIHNLEKYPSVTVFDSAGSVIIGAVEYVDVNNMILHFSAPFSGKATLN